MIETKDIYWLAGLLEGEGCFKWDAATPRIDLGMCDLDVVQRAAQLLRPVTYRKNGNDVSTYFKKGREKPMQGVRIAGARAAGWMMTLYPLMGERRQARIREVLALWRLRPNQRRAYGLTRYAPELLPKETKAA